MILHGKLIPCAVKHTFENRMIENDLEDTQNLKVNQHHIIMSVSKIKENGKQKVAGDRKADN